MNSGPAVFFYMDISYLKTIFQISDPTAQFLFNNLYLQMLHTLISCKVYLQHKGLACIVKMRPSAFLNLTSTLAQIESTKSSNYRCAINVPACVKGVGRQAGCFVYQQKTPCQIIVNKQFFLHFRLSNNRQLSGCLIYQNHRCICQ